MEAQAANKDVTVGRHDWNILELDFVGFDDLTATT
jgi:hypothetical protein